MVRSNKAPSKKQQNRGVDFKKIKRKIGRKLPPQKNATNTEIKSKAIILREQSVASEKTGLAVSKKGLTLKELLPQTSHHNSKVRNDALIGIRDIFLKHPLELKLHKVAVVEKLRERITDDDKLVRETLYQLLKSVIFPGFKEDNQGPFISLMMAYVFSGMTHLSIDVRLMAFRFFDLIVQYFPSSFSLYAEKIFQNYSNILQRNQLHLQDKGKLKSALAGLTHCLSLLPCNKQEDDSSFENDDDSQGVLHGFEPHAPKDLTGLFVITKKLKDLLPILVGCFQDFIPLLQSTTQLDAQSFDCMLCILESIDLVIRFFVNGFDKSQLELQAFLSSGGINMTVEDLNISPVLLKKLWDAFPLNPTHHLSEKDDDRYFILNVVTTKIFLRLSDLTCPPAALLDKFLGFIENSLSRKVRSGKQSGKTFREKHLLLFVPFIPKLVVRVASNWKSCILQAFTKFFKDCHPESSLKMACLSAIEELLVPKEGCLHLEATDSEILDYKISWIRELPSLLIQLGEKYPLQSKAVLQLQLRIGQCAWLNSPLSPEYDNMQHSLKGFYCMFLDEGGVHYGPFMRLSTEIQELSVCCLYYFSFLDSLLLQSLTSCCLCHDLDPHILFRVMEILHSSYKAGHIQMADYISFLITLVSRFKVFPEKVYPALMDPVKSNHGTFKLVTTVVCSFLSEIGDDHLVFKMLETLILHQMSLKPPVDSMCALLRVLVTLDSRPTKLSEHSITCLGKILPEYLIDVVLSIPEDDAQSNNSIPKSRRHYYLLPCLFLFHRSGKLLSLVLTVLGSLVKEISSSLLHHDHLCTTDHSSRIKAVVSILCIIMQNNKVHNVLLLYKRQIDSLLQNILNFQSKDINMTFEERRKILRAFDKLKLSMST